MDNEEKWVPIFTAKDTKELNKILSLLEDEEIVAKRVSEDSLEVMTHKSDAIGALNSIREFFHIGEKTSQLEESLVLRRKQRRTTIKTLAFVCIIIAVIVTCFAIFLNLKA